MRPLNPSDIEGHTFGGHYLKGRLSKVRPLNPPDIEGHTFCGTKQWLERMKNKWIKIIMEIGVYSFMEMSKQKQKHIKQFILKLLYICSNFYYRFRHLWTYLRP